MGRSTLAMLDRNSMAASPGEHGRATARVTIGTVQSWPLNKNPGKNLNGKAAGLRLSIQNEYDSHNAAPETKPPKTPKPRHGPSLCFTPPQHHATPSKGISIQTLSSTLAKSLCLSSHPFQKYSTAPFTPPPNPGREAPLHVLLSSHGAHP